LKPPRITVYSQI